MVKNNFYVDDFLSSVPSVSEVSKLIKDIAALCAKGRYKVGILVKAVDYEIRIDFWTDRQSVLRYLANKCSPFYTFVANQAAVIKELTELQQWNYIATELNLADCASRRLLVKRLLNKEMWFKRLAFLSQPKSE